MLKESESVLCLPTTLSAMKIDTPPIMKIKKVRDDVVMLLESGFIDMVCRVTLLLRLIFLAQVDADSYNSMKMTQAIGMKVNYSL